MASAGTHGRPARENRVHTARNLVALLDVMLPDGELPGHRSTGVLSRLAAEIRAERDPNVVQLFALLRALADSHGVSQFYELSLEARERVIVDLMDAKEHGLLVLRTRALELHYSHAAMWQALGFPGPPQPRGFTDYQHAPTGDEAA